MERFKIFATSTGSKGFALDAANLSASQRSAASEALREALSEMGPVLAARQESMAGTVAVRPEIAR